MEYVQERIATLHDFDGTVPAAPTDRAAVVVPLTERDHASSSPPSASSRGSNGSTWRASSSRCGPHRTRSATSSAGSTASTSTGRCCGATRRRSSRASTSAGWTGTGEGTGRLAGAGRRRAPRPRRRPRRGRDDLLGGPRPETPLPAGQRLPVLKGTTPASRTVGSTAASSGCSSGRCSRRSTRRPTTRSSTTCWRSATPWPVSSPRRARWFERCASSRAGGSKSGRWATPSTQRASKVLLRSTSGPTKTTTAPSAGRRGSATCVRRGRCGAVSRARRSGRRPGLRRAVGRLPRRGWRRLSNGTPPTPRSTAAEYDPSGERDQVDQYAAAIRAPGDDHRLPAWNDCELDPETVRELSIWAIDEATAE